MRILMKFLLFAVVLVSGCGADLTTKHIARNTLKHNSITIIQDLFQLTYIENHAIAFGFLGSLEKNFRMPLIFFLGIAACCLLSIMVWRLRYKRFFILLPFAIILSGAFGNLTDRLWNGYVTDFFYFHYSSWSFPVFNLADVLISAGTLLLFIQIRTSDLVEDLLPEKP